MTDEAAVNRSGRRRGRAEMALPAEGGCRCARLRFRVSVPPLMTAVCHCRGCQRMSGAPFSTTAIIPSRGFAVLAGATVTGGIKGPDLNHFHCPDCLSWVFTRVVGLEDQFVNVRATLFDDPSWFEPYIETCTASKLPWVHVPAVHSFEGFPDMEAYAGLVAEYAAGARVDA
jgi:hypothetical protein